VYNIYSEFIPGDIPGDPELGGWRPLPKNFFRKTNVLSVYAPTLNLKEAIKTVAFNIRYLCLHRAVSALGARLSGN
jgi:hypothetical protein